ncbi:MAG TPA: hypothetical protein VGO55_09070 [Allosphingosinicella sp.]|jgi:predicted small secreted protein|nr:hypothetical protein [Allosphingosinicella sp.]
MKRPPIAPIALLASCAVLAACGPARERSVNEIYDETNRVIVNRAADYEGRVETDLKATGQSLEDQANEQLRSIEANAANTVNAALGNEVAGNGQ